MAHIESTRQLIERDDRRIAPAPLETAQILLAQTRALGNLFLRQVLGLTQAGEISSDQLAHIHAQTDRNSVVPSLSTIICKRIWPHGTWSVRPELAASNGGVRARDTMQAKGDVVALDIADRPYVAGPQRASDLTELTGQIGELLLEEGLNHAVPDP